MKFLPLAATLAIVYAGSQYSKEHYDYKKVAYTTYILGLFASFAPMMLLLFY